MKMSERMSEIAPSAVFVFHPCPPYDFYATAWHAAYGESRYAADMFEDGVFTRALTLDGCKVAVSIKSEGSIAAPAIEVSVFGHSLEENTARQAADIACRMVGAHIVLAPFYESIDTDPPVAELVNRFRGLSIPQAASPFEAIILSIIGQQISSHVARMLRDMLVDEVGGGLEVGGKLWPIFPSAEAIAAVGVDRLRELKFSARKAEYICDIAAAVASGDLDLDALRGLPDTDIVERLVGLRGVGPWTAHWMLIRAYDSPDGFPFGDLAVQRILGTLYGAGQRLSPKDTLALSERWKPYRSFVTTYLFADIRSARNSDIVSQR